MKRVNPKTNAPFKRGDLREDGARFMRYCTNRPVRKDGFFVEDWQSLRSQKKGIKRINPKTKRPFKKGDEDPNTGKVFYQYDRKGSDKNGYAYEVWITKSKLIDIRKKTHQSARKSKALNKEQAKSGIIKKRLNPLTGKTFKRGDVDEKGRIFITYNSASVTNGFVGEEWGDEWSIARRQIAANMANAKKRADKKGVKFSVTFDYLVSIFPKDSRCPIFKTKMNWLGDKSDSPSIDRIIPELGYEEGNVAWVSNRANTMKLNRTPEILRKIADWIEAEQKKVRFIEKN